MVDRAATPEAMMEAMLRIANMIREKCSEGKIVFHQDLLQLLKGTQDTAAGPQVQRGGGQEVDCLLLDISNVFYLHIPDKRDQTPAKDCPAGGDWLWKEQPRKYSAWSQVKRR